MERTIASQLGVSHIPVREALARLADEGLVQRIPRRGAWVAGLTPVGLAEISSLHIVLEGFVVRRAQERLTPAAEARLRSIAARMPDAADAAWSTRWSSSTRSSTGSCGRCPTTRC